LLVNAGAKMHQAAPAEGWAWVGLAAFGDQAWVSRPAECDRGHGDGSAQADEGAAVKFRDLRIATHRAGKAMSPRIVTAFGGTGFLGVRRCTSHPPGGDVRTGRHVSHDHSQAPPPASNFSDVGRGLMRLQPAYVEDVAEAIARALQRTEIRIT
jgi:hypothetical protein